MPSTILHLISNLASGGAEAMLSKVVRATADRNTQHIVISMTDGGIFGQEIAAAKIAVVELGLGRGFGAARALWPIVQAIRQYRPNVIQGWMYHANIAASVANAMVRHRSPVIWNIRQTVQDLGQETLITRLSIRAGAPLSRQPVNIVYNSTRAAIDHETLGYAAGRRVIIPNGFDLNQFRPDQDHRWTTRNLLNVPSDALVIGRVASFSDRKDIDTLFAAFTRIATAQPRAHLALVGRGMDFSNPKISAFAGTLPGRLHALGERSDVERILPAFDLSISSSKRAEGFPNVIGEAMACGVPVITTDVGDSGWVVGDPSRVVAPGDPDAIAEQALRILALSDAERIALGQSDRARIAAHFALPAIAAQYLALWHAADGPRSIGIGP